MIALHEVNGMAWTLYSSPWHRRQYEEYETVGAETLVVRYKSERERSLFLSFKDYFRLFFRLLQLWIKNNDVLTIALRDNPDCVEQLEGILHFMLQEKAFNQADLDAIWAVQVATETRRFLCEFYACSRMERMMQSWRTYTIFWRSLRGVFLLSSLIIFFIAFRYFAICFSSCFGLLSTFRRVGCTPESIRGRN